MPRDSLEQGLQICGLLFFRNEMKVDSKEAFESRQFWVASVKRVYQELKLGGITCVICTGDNTTTGVSIGRQCGVISDSTRVFIGELDSAHASHAAVPAWQSDPRAELALSQPAFRWLVREDPEELKKMLPSVKVFGRMKPDDKIKVINLWQDYGEDGTVTGMTGDGGNDCGALRTAHAGLALSEAEASMDKGLAEEGFISLSAVAELVKEGRCCLATNMATFMYFMIYNLTLTTSKMAAVAWLDSTYAEWQFMLTDVALAMVMVSFMIRCRPEKTLAPRSPSASLFGTGTTVTILSALLIFWLTAGVAVLLLQYGPGRSFYEFSTSILLDLPPEQWTKKGDNFIMATLFLVNLTVLLNAGFVLCYGHVHRQVVGKNWRICSFYLCGLFFTLALLWAHPGNFSCTFRVNCDSVASQNMNIPLLSKPVGGIIFSTGNLGGCFWGPQMVSCKSKDGHCWVTPPEDAQLPPSWNSNATRPQAPFKDTWLSSSRSERMLTNAETREEKEEYCRKHPYTPGDAENLGNKWCWKPADSGARKSCGPEPERDLGRMVKGCHGPNNCFDQKYKVALTGVLIASSVALHVMYKLGVLGLKMMISLHPTLSCPPLRRVHRLHRLPGRVSRPLSADPPAVPGPPWSLRLLISGLTLGESRRRAATGRERKRHRLPHAPTAPSPAASPVAEHPRPAARARLLLRRSTGLLTARLLTARPLTAGRVSRSHLRSHSRPFFSTTLRLKVRALEVPTEVRLTSASLPRIGTPSLLSHVHQWRQPGKPSGTGLGPTRRRPSGGDAFRSTCPAAFTSVRRPHLESRQRLATAPSAEPKSLVQAGRTTQIIEESFRSVLCALSDTESSTRMAKGKEKSRGVQNGAERGMRSYTAGLEEIFRRLHEGSRRGEERALGWAELLDSALDAQVPFMDREAMLQAFYFGLYGLPPATDLPSVPSRFRAPAGAAAGAPGAARAGEASGERLKRLAGNLQQLQITLQEALRQVNSQRHPGAYLLLTCHLGRERPPGCQNFPWLLLGTLLLLIGLLCGPSGNTAGTAGTAARASQPGPVAEALELRGAAEEISVLPTLLAVLLLSVARNGCEWPVAVSLLGLSLLGASPRVSGGSPVLAWRPGCGHCALGLAHLRCRSQFQLPPRLWVKVPCTEC
eukprot:g18287.t1